MAMRVTIILDTGGFLPPEDPNQTYLDIGYFETPNASDIEVTDDRATSLKTGPDKKLGRGNQRIEVEHVENGTGNRRNEAPPAKSIKGILHKDYLYDKTEMPDFIPATYDCILRFHSGDFVSEDLRKRSFTQHRVSDNSKTGVVKETEKAIANEIHVHYDLADGDVLRLRREDGSDLWSSDEVAGVTGVKVKILAHEDRNRDYHKRALAHSCEYYYMPNSDPPPQNGPSGG